MLAELRSLVESELERMLPPREAGAAVRYAMFSGGRRMRPVLTLLAVHACKGDVRQALPAACAIECLHCASLIWDDMPCMDNAKERRGAAPVHIPFGEGVATLAALSLMNRAYAIFGRYEGLMEEAAHCVEEMVAGQAADLEGGRDLRKTSGLLRLTLSAGAIACGTAKREVNVMARCGELIGEAYQLLDDFEDGDAASDAGAAERLAQARGMLQHHFGISALPLLAALEQIAERCARKPVAA